MDTKTNHEGFNLFVQQVQRDAESWRIETGFEPIGIYNFFYAIWDDKKWFLGREVPFVKGGDRDARIVPDLWIQLQCRMADALIGSTSTHKGDRE